jgi:DNA-binding NarL/FixJ family response regulator
MGKPGQIRRILLIDDSPITLKALRTVLGLRPSWQVVGEANDGIEGIRLFHQLQPDVAIVDFQMPGITGLQVGREIRRSGANVLLILFSLHAGPELENAAREVGFDAVVSKTNSFPVVGIIETMKKDSAERTPIATPPVPPSSLESHAAGK